MAEAELKHEGKIVKEYRIRKSGQRGWVLEYRFGDLWVDHSPALAGKRPPLTPGEIMTHMEGTAGMDTRVTWEITYIKEVA